MKKTARLPWIQRHRTAERGRVVFVLVAALALAVSGLADFRVGHIEHRNSDQKMNDALSLLDTVKTLGAPRPRQRPALHLVQGGRAR